MKKLLKAGVSLTFSISACWWGNQQFPLEEGPFSLGGSGGDIGTLYWKNLKSEL